MARKNKKRPRSIVLSNSQASSPSSEPPGSNPEVAIDVSEEEIVQGHPWAADAQAVTDVDSAPDAPLEMAQDVWEALREEFFEQVEQLPLSLHRSFAIIGEQDKEAEACQAELLPTIRSYVKLRQALHGKMAAAEGDPQLFYPTSTLGDNDPGPSAGESNSAALDQTKEQRRMDTSLENDIKVSKSNEQVPHKEEDLDVTMEAMSPQQLHRNGVTSNLCSSTPSRGTENSHSPDKLPQSASARTQGLRETDATVPKSVPFPPRPKPKTTRELLTRISFLMGELVRASEEKVGLATAAYDSVDRHVRALDAAIKEHEAVAALGLRDGTRPVGTAVQDENDPTLSEDVDEDDEEPQLGMIGPSAGAGRRPTQRFTRNKKRDRRDQRRHVIAERPTIRLHAPPPSNVNILGPPARDMPIDPHEPRYCYCNQVSYGEMIACDNSDCSREWFHLGCAGLAAPPKGKVKWYCRECEEALGRTKRRRVR